ncbi:MAG: sulfotransferase domain-containing protein [Candidatus Aenigmatarchaeota archaeon]
MEYLDFRPEVEGSIELAYKVFFVAPYKSGSTMLFEYVRDLLKYFNIAFIDYPSFYFLKHYNLLRNFYDNESSYKLYDKKIAYIGHREIPISLLKNNLCKDFATFVLLRNPLDALVSMYFSFIYSHPIPDSWDDETKRKAKEHMEELKRKFTIEAYVIENAHFYHQILKRIFEFCNKSMFYRIIKYENIIFDKKLLVENILDFLNCCSIDSNFDLPKDQLDTLAYKYHIIPEKENIYSHIRKVIPGDYKEKLKEDICRYLATTFYDLVKDFYPELREYIR